MAFLRPRRGVLFLIDLSATHEELVEIEKQIRESTAKHNAFLKELGLSPLPASDQ
jgi:type I restriction enzyme M protein